MLTNFNMLFRVVNIQNGSAVCHVSTCRREEDIILVIQDTYFSSTNYTNYRSRNSAIVIATGYGLNNRWIGV
jgi:hypothetical protein